MEASSGGVPESYALPQNNESSLHQGLGHQLPFGFRSNDQDSDQLQADRSHLLFGMSIDQPLGGSSVVSPQSYRKSKDDTGNNMLLTAYGPLVTPDSMNNGILSGEGLDGNGLFQRNSGWPAMPVAIPPRTFTKVHFLSSLFWQAFIKDFYVSKFPCIEPAGFLLMIRSFEILVYMFGSLKQTLSVKGCVRNYFFHLSYLFSGTQAWIGGEIFGCTKFL